MMNGPDSQDIPIVVETLSRSYFPMHRCSYLYVECDEPRPGWRLNTMPFLMLGLIGIIQVPFGAARFEQYQHLTQLFQVLEDQMGMTINFADIWLPDFMFRSKRVRVGDVYRLDLEMFKNAFLFRDARMPQSMFLGQAERLGESLHFSESETRVFAAWSQENMAALLQQPDKNPELRLRTRE
jgi:hypothetical protein